MARLGEENGGMRRERARDELEKKKKKKKKEKGKEMNKIFKVV